MIAPRYDVSINSDYANSNVAYNHIRYANTVSLSATQIDTLLDINSANDLKLIMLNIGGDGYGEFLIYINDELIAIEKNSYFMQSKTLFFRGELYAKKIRVDVKNASWQLQNNNYYASIIVRLL
ncbi:MAG: hypothetical protein QW255_04595 [Candidatus Bilamarchaeaceae archaeon]